MLELKIIDVKNLATKFAHTICREYDILNSNKRLRISNVYAVILYHAFTRRLLPFLLITAKIATTIQTIIDIRRERKHLCFQLYIYI